MAHACRRLQWISPTAMSFALIAGAPGLASAEPGDQFLAVTLKPASPDDRGLVSSVRVVEQFEVAPTAAHTPLLRLPLITSNVQTVATSVTDLAVRDADGPLALNVKDDAPGGEPVYRHWSADRAVHGLLTMSYAAPITNALNPRGAAPPLELRTENGGFSGVFGTFLLLPDSEALYRLKLHWDFSAIPGGGSGVSSLGAGDVVALKSEPPKEMGSVYVMGGRIHTFPETPAKTGFLSAWQGQPPFDTAAAMRWTQNLYGYYLTFFKVGAGKPYTVFLRRNLINAGGGVELGSSFVGTFDDKVKVEDLKFTLAHEMVHTFVGSLDGADLTSSWFSEGLAVYYERALPLRAGQITADAFLKDLNTTAGRYYTDILNTAPNSEVSKRFWADTRIRVLPYDRGSLYFAALDEKVRAHSRGARSLDDLMLAMVARRNAGLPLDEKAWTDLLRAELGPDGVANFDAMLAGKLVLPPSDSFGPCFQRTTKPLRRYELGFATDVLIQPKRIVRDLQLGSAAALAGVRNGDEIVKPVPQDLIQSDQTALLHLVIRRDGKLMDITYLPRGEIVEVYQWEMTARGDGRCSGRSRSSRRRQAGGEVEASPWLGR